MDDPPATAGPGSADAPTIRGLANAATIRGAAALVIGLLVLLLPGFSITLVEAAVALGLLASGLYDIWYALTGRRRGHRRVSRLLALVRGPASIVFAIFVAYGRREALDLLVELMGVYLGVRGLLAITAALFARDWSGRRAEIGRGFAAIGFGVLALFAPDEATTGLIAGGALLAVLLGAIVLTYGLRGASDGVGLEGSDAPVTEILWDWVRSADVGARRREELADGLYFEQPGRASKLVAWWVMLILSVVIATYAVLQDSTPVVIGAMLIAPLMVPILGLAGALVNGWSPRAAASGRLLVGGVAAAVVLAYALSSWAPVAVAFDTNSQITSRITPSLLDMLVAVAAGAAGAFATVNVRVASSIAGVAIAVALVPPLSVVGISLGAQRYSDAGGAMLLFLTNFVAIVLAAAAVFTLGGFAQHDLLRSRSRDVVFTLGPFVALAAIILIPLVFNSQGLLASATDQRLAQNVVEDWLGEDTQLDVQTVEVDADAVGVALLGPAETPPLEVLQASLIEELGRPVAVAVSVTPVTLTDLPVPLREPD